MSSQINLPFVEPKKQRRKREQPLERREVSINLRLTGSEVSVLDGVCQAHGGIPRAAMVRQMMTFGTAPTISPVNREAFGVLTSVAERLCELRDLIDTSVFPASSAELIGQVERGLSEVRRVLLGIK